ncbi:homeobox-like domain superfamily [Holotrichia oblita]|uniref:Homeobox-like domain superfamily n=1 Tax=Holotrichia oblita TaxID=644536 RepID=A0ACB9TX75_HOLOL|nr:homeobox-like domain superfamily [Holotrichia oblita]
MDRQSNLTEHEVAQAIVLVNDGRSRYVANLLGVQQSTISRTVRCFNEYGILSRVRGQGRRKSTNERDDRFLRQLALKMRRSTSSELSRALAEDRPYNVEHFSEYHFRDDNIVGAYLIMDNVRFHKNAEVLNLIQAHGHHAVFIPAYSPFLNPNEELFSQWKNYIKRSQSRNADELYQFIHRVSENITHEHCLDYI